VIYFSINMGTGRNVGNPGIGSQSAIKNAGMGLNSRSVKQPWDEIRDFP
jgi:hypothetical protein